MRNHTAGPNIIQALIDSRQKTNTLFDIRPCGGVGKPLNGLQRYILCGHHIRKIVLFGTYGPRLLLAHGVAFRIHVECIRTDILLVGPSYSPVFRSRLSEIVLVTEFLEHVKVEEGRAIEHSGFSVCELEFQLVVIGDGNVLDSWIHDVTSKARVRRGTLKPVVCHVELF